MVKIYNRNLDRPPKSAAYVGRGSKYGNPYVIGKDGNRLVVIQKYRKWLRTQPDLIEEMRRELAGKDLVCYCSPYLCHAEIIDDIVNKGVDFDTIPAKQ